MSAPPPPQTLALADGRTIEYYDARTADTELTVIYHHGTPNVGEPPAPLVAPAAERGIGWVSVSRPGYGASTRVPGRAVAQIARDVATVADALALERFAVLGHSGGGPHALACAALLPDRVSAAVSISGLAPLVGDAVAWEGESWFAGMHPSGVTDLQAAREGADARAARIGVDEWDPGMFTPGDFAALEGEWAWLNRVVELAMEGGPDGMVDDDVAYVNPWGFEPHTIAAPTLLIHGQRDRVVPASHSVWLGQRVPYAEVWLEPEHSHISVLARAREALDWIAAHAR